MKTKSRYPTVGAHISVRLILLCMVLAIAPVTVYAQSAEEEKIKQVIKAETEAFISRNAEAWKATWMQDSEATRTFASSYSYSSAIGFDKFGPDMIEGLKESPEALPLALSTQNYVIRIGGDLAWAEYDQVLKFTDNSSEDWISREYRVLVRNNDQWKIVTQITLNSDSFGTSPNAIESNMNEVGYKLMTAEKLNEAIEIFKMNTQLNPQAWNTFDSLGEAYAKAGNKKMAIQSYEKSIELNPKNEAGKVALAKLKQL